MSNAFSCSDEILIWNFTLNWIIRSIIDVIITIINSFYSNFYGKNENLAFHLIFRISKHWWKNFLGIARWNSKKTRSLKKIDSCMEWGRRCGDAVPFEILHSISIFEWKWFSKLFLTSKILIKFFDILVSGYFNLYDACFSRNYVLVLACINRSHNVYLMSVHIRNKLCFVGDLLEKLIWLYRA